MKSKKLKFKPNKMFIIIAIIVVILLAWTLIKSFSTNTDSSAWDGVVARNFTSGTGTENNPYVISTPGELAYFKQVMESDNASAYATKYYRIVNNLNYGEYNISINNEVPFSGIIDGNYNFISNVEITNSLFSKLENATIKNLNLQNMSIIVNTDTGIIANEMYSSNISSVILNGEVDIPDDFEDAINVAGIVNVDNTSIIENTIVNFVVDENINYVSIVNDGVDTEINDVLINREYEVISKTNLLDISSVYEFIVDDDEIVVEDKILNKFNNVVVNGGLFIFNIVPSEANSSKAPNRSPAISLHASGVDGTSVYVNDLVADQNYYTGRNYTEITNANGTIPTGNIQSLYTSSNLATVYIRYNSADINDSTIYGTVSVSENVRDYYYYKKYPVSGGYLEFDLIDNPWASRPNGKAFNGWVTDYTDAVISLDVDTYTRSVKIPVSDITEPISITFYTSWTNATLAETTNGVVSRLKNIRMVNVGDYGTLTNYYINAHIDQNKSYPSDIGNIYNTSGRRITDSSCTSRNGCDFYRLNTDVEYNENVNYYTITTNGNNATFTRVYPSKVNAISYYTTGDYVAGLFQKVTSGSTNIYNASGEKITSCGNSCYKLLQYSDGTLDPNASYYYLVTRDTNVFVPNSTSTVTTANVTVDKPMTITGINNRTDNSNSRTIQLNSNWTLSADLRVEFIRFYVSETSTTVDSFSSNGYKILGNFKNLKLGRGLKRYTTNNNNYLTATSFVGGNNSSTSSLTKYSLIVESGFYQNGSATGYSSYNHYVNANVILGNDYDRVNNNNDNLIVYYCYAGSWGSNLYSSSGSSNTYDKPAVHTTIKSGSFGTNKRDYAAGVYVGGRAGGTHYAIREILVEGGYIYNLIGGPASASARASKNDIIINVKGGNIDLVFGGAGATDTVGNKIINVTGGTINYSILGGSNANQYASNTTNPYGKIDGDTLVYVGGNVTVGTKNDTLYTVPSGDVYGAGNGRSGELDVGAVNNSHVIIGPSATIKGDVYGGGNNGAVGGNTVGTVSLDGGAGSSAVTGGLYEDGTTDNSIRYYGNSPDNYIQFNGELYRIIGLFNNVNTANGNKDLIRIVKNTSLGNRAWGDANMSTVATNTSTETSSGWFGNDTYNYTNYYKNYYNFYVKNDNSKSNMYNYLNTTYYNGLNSTYRDYIEEVNWGIGATAGANQNASNFYIAERSSGVVNYLTGVNQTGNGNSAYSSLFKVGLFYPSDYGFANNDNTCITSSLDSYSATCRNNNWMSGMTNAWTMTSSTNVTSVTKEYQVSRTGSIFNGYTYTMNRYYHVTNRNFVIGTGGLELKDIYYTDNDNDANNYYNTGAVYPSFYLKDNVTISGGTGTSSDPYIIGSSDNKLTDIIYELMNPAVVEPTEPVVVTYEESDYQSRTHIQILGGSIEGSVFGAGNSNGAGNNTKGTNGNVALSKVTIDMNGGSVSKSIYGGSNELGTVYGDVFINIENGNIGESVYGGGKGGYSSSEDGTYVACNVNVNIGSANTTNLTIHDSVYGGSALGSVNTTEQNATTTSYATLVTVNDGVIIGSVFGGGEGDSSHTPQVVGPITVTINDGDITSVFGGNDQAGSHTNLNRVYLNDGTIDNVYGGGNKSSVTNTHVYLQGSTVTNLYGGSNTLGDVSTTSVQIKSGTVQNVYGGNNEGGTCDVTNVTVVGTATVNGSIYGGGNQVDTTTTNVILTSAGSTIPKVFGGGSSASVGTSTITKTGTTVTELFGGSDASGTVTTSTIDHSGGTTTTLYGGNNTAGNTLASNIQMHSGTVTTMYGGGKNANGNTSRIEMDGGTVTTMFGGGNSAGLTSSTVIVTAGTVTNVYGGSDTTGTVNSTSINLSGTTGTVAGIYGGGRRAQVGSTSVVVGSGTITNIFGGGDLAQATGNTLVDINGGTITGSVYGGGNLGVVKGNSTVTITDATILGSAYAGGKGSTAILEGSTSITIDGNTVIGTTNSVPPTSGSVFGGGDQAATGLEVNNNSTSTVNIVSGTFYGNIYGGANTSVIYGNTIVNIGNDAVNNSSLDEGDIYIKGHVFGGGEANASGSEIYDWNFISVTQGTHINVDANGHTNFKIDGSFYGGGNASSASGTSYLSIKNYGTPTNPKTNVSIQRVDNVTLDNTSILLKGAYDKANDYDTELFAISRVINLKIKNNTSLFLENKANLLENFESLDSSGNKASVTIDEEHNTVTKTVDNRLYAYEGVNINIAKNQNVTDYGIVSGMTFFGLYNYDNNRNVNTGIYSPIYDAGDELDWSGTFTRGSYVLGKHLSNHNIKVDGFYSNYINEETTINEVKYIVPSPDDSDYYMWDIGEKVLEYNIPLVASKYSTLGSVEYSFMDYYKPNTSFYILGFDSADIATGVTLVDRNNIPRIAPTAAIANNQFGLAMEASNTGWLTTGKTSFYTSEPSISGPTYYEGENSSVVPTMLFYLYHSKNLSEAKDLGTVRISIMSVTKLNALSNEIKRFVLNIQMSTALFQTTEYEGAMTAGDKYELFTSTNTNITTKSKFSTYYALYAANENAYQTGYHRVLVSSFVFPENTKITMLDFVNGVPEYYYHIITAADVQAAQAEYNLSLNSERPECSYALSMFTKMGSRSNNSNYSDATMNAIYYDGTDSSEEFVFIVDFSDTTIANTQLDNFLYIELRDSHEETIVGVLGIQRQELVYNLYAGCDSSIDMTITESLNPLYIGYNDIFNVLINYQNSSVSGVSVTDTQYFDSKLGLQIYVLNSDNHVVSGTDLTGTYFSIDNVKYYPDIDGYTHIKLSDKVGNTQKWVTFNTENSSLATGTYRFVFETFGSPDGIYYSNGDTDDVTRTISIINMTYGFKPEINPNSVIFNGTGNDKNLVFTVGYESRLENPNVRMAMYRRKYDQIYDTNYELVDLQDYVNQSLFTTNNQNEYLIVEGPSSTNNVTLRLEDELLTGTYRLSFRLYDGDTMIGEVVRYIVIK